MPDPPTLFTTAGGFQVRLGRVKPDTPRVPTVRIDRFLKAGTPPPPAVDWRPKAAAAIRRMYANDTLGCCVASDGFHRIGVATGNATGVPAVAQDSEVVQTYHAVGGPGDNGLVVEQFLQYGVDHGLPVNGRIYKYESYAAIDWTDRSEVMTAVDLFPGVTVGLTLLRAWERQRVWTDVGGVIAGGHDVLVVAYDDVYVYLSSWGDVYAMPWDVFLGRKYLDEAWVVSLPSWLVNGVSPNGFKAVFLQGAIKIFQGGGTPPLDPPTPDPAPVPTPTPVPPQPTPTPTPVPTPVPVPPPPAPQPTVEDAARWARTGVTSNAWGWLVRQGTIADAANAAERGVRTGWAGWKKP